MEQRYGHYPERARELQSTGDLHLAWDVPYQPGVLKAVGSKGGQVVSVTEVATTGVPARLSLSADRMTLGADRRDLAHLTIEVEAAEGRRVPTADNPVTLNVRGQGRMLGMDNGDPESHQAYRGPQYSAFGGLGLVLVGATDRAGDVDVVASSPGLAEARLRLTTTRLPRPSKRG